MRRAWTKIEEHALIEAYRAGVSPAKIAKALGRSFDSVTCKWVRIRVGL